MNRRRVRSLGLVDARDHDGGRDSAEAPGQQNDSVNAAHEFWSEEVGRKRRHDTESAAITESDKGDGDAKRRDAVGAR